MTLPMSRPQKHPKSGVYWLRKRVPEDLLALVGKREEKLSLGTRNPEEAKRLHAHALIEIEARWANLRHGARSLTQQEIDEAAGFLCNEYVAHFGTGNNGQAARARHPDGKAPWSKSEVIELLDKAPASWWALPTGDDNGPNPSTHAFATAAADEYLRRKGYSVTPESRAKLVEAFSRAIKHGGEIVVISGELGNYSSAPNSRQSLPDWALAAAYGGPPATEILPMRDIVPQTPKGKQVSFDDLFAGWVAEKQPREKTRYAWQSVLAQLGKFVGHTDASRVTADDLIGWKASLLQAKLRPKTIRDGKLAPVRALFQWGVDNRRLSGNPAQRVTIDLRGKLTDKKRGYTDDEARMVITAALSETSALLHWVPQLCAYTGARVSEVCQLRVEDVLEQEKIWCVRFAPEAGALKNANSERLVPLHSAMLKQGFIKFAKKAGSGPLFTEIKPDRFGSRGGNGTKVLSRWVRSLGLTDKRLSPSHSWRHRLRTLGRRHELATDILDAITGHQRKTVADTYGEFQVQALQRELEKIPVL